MKRTVWKWLLGISIAVFMLLILFTLGIWALSNVGAVLVRLVFILDEDLQIGGIPFAAVMENFVGSPMFYAFVADLAVLTTSVTALIVTKKR
jgi:hypothetical protein